MILYLLEAVHLWWEKFCDKFKDFKDFKDSKIQRFQDSKTLLCQMSPDSMIPGIVVNGSSNSYSK